MRTAEKQIFKIPNLLSILRIALIPVFAWAYLYSGGSLLPGAILAVSGITDMLDGFIARRFNMITELGKVLDPVADKLTQFVIFLCLSVRYPLFGVLFLVFFIKEILMLAGGVILYRRHIRPGAAKWFGKLATCFFYLSSLLIVFVPLLDERYINMLIIINLALFLFALVRYIPVFFTLKKAGL